MALGMRDLGVIAVSVWSALKRVSGWHGAGSGTTAEQRPHAPVAAASPTGRAAWLEQKLREYVDTLGPDHHRSIAARNNLAAKYAEIGRRDAAIEQFERALADSARTLGEDDPQTDIIRENLASSLEDAHRHAEAAAHWETLLRQRSQRFGPDALETVNARASLAAAYRRTGRIDAAVAHFERAVEDAVALSPEQTEGLRLALGRAYRDSQRFDDTARQLRMVLAMRRRRLGGQHPDTLSIHLHLGRILLWADRIEEAARTLEDAYRGAWSASGDPEVRVLLLRIRRDLARTLRALGRDREAAALR